MDVLVEQPEGRLTPSPLVPAYGRIENVGQARGQLQLTPAAASLPFTHLRIRAEYTRPDGSKVKGFNDIRLVFPQH